LAGVFKSSNTVHSFAIISTLTIHFAKEPNKSSH
jgi:hypothetical protein